MTTDRAGREHNAEVVPLRAVDAQTEVLLDEGTQPGAAYVDLTGTGGQRKQIIPEHWRTWENARRHVGLILGRRAHWCAYHGVRLPSYAVKAVAFAVVGVLVTGRKVTSWWHIPGTTHLEYQAAADGLLNEHLRLHKQGRETRTARGTIIVLVLAAAVLMVIAEARYAPWVFVPEAVAVFALLVLAGSKGTGKPIASPARIPDQVQPPTPDVIVRAGGGGVGPLPFGTDPRGRRVSAALIEHNWLIGSLPGQGKTSAVRVLACCAILDPTVEAWIHELKGTGDLDQFEQVSHRFVSGIDDESIAYTAESLKILRHKVIPARADQLKRLPREVCPDKKVTRQIANRRGLKLWPLMCVIDELQNVFAHEKYGKQAGDDATFIIKIGRALGVFLILATQRPDKDSLPTAVSGNVSTRFCLKVAGQVENDMILGTSAYRNGARATTFRPKIDAGIGYLKGEENAAQVVRTYYLNSNDAERVANRARALREAAGTLSGVALGEDDGAPRRDVLADAAEVLAGATGLHWQALADRLAERFPERWAEATGDAVRAELGARGVPSVVVVMDGQRARGCRAADVDKAASGT